VYIYYVNIETYVESFYDSDLAKDTCAFFGIVIGKTTNFRTLKTQNDSSASLDDDQILNYDYPLYAVVLLLVARCPCAHFIGCKRTLMGIQKATYSTVLGIFSMVGGWVDVNGINNYRPTKAPEVVVKATFGALPVFILYVINQSIQFKVPDTTVPY